MTVLALHTAADMLDFLSVASRFLLLLPLLAPGVGLAGQEAPATPMAWRSASLERLTPASTGLPGTAAHAPLRLREDTPAQEEEAPRPSRGLRILAETGAGLLTSLGVGFVGLVAGAGLCEAGIVGSKNETFIPCLSAGGIGFILGAAAGFPLGVWWGGDAAGGDGKLLGALAGLGAGTVGGFLLGLMVGGIGGALILAVPAALIGSIVGYEYTQPKPVPTPQEAPALASARPRLQPVLAFSQHGALVGLGGSF